MKISLNNNSNRLFSFAKLLRFPEKDIKDIKNRLKFFSKEINRNISDRKLYQQKELVKYSRLLNSNALHTNLKKGYSIIKKEDTIINKSNLIHDEDLIDIRFF